MDAYKLIKSIEETVRSPDVKVKIYNLHNGATVHLNLECWRLYDYDLAAYLREEFGSPIGEDELSYEVVSLDEQAVADYCFKNGELDFSKHEEYTEAVMEFGEDVVASALYCGFTLEKLMEGEIYKGSYESLAAFAEDEANCLGDIPEHLRRYIDWERYADDHYEQSHYIDDSHVFDATR